MGTNYYLVVSNERDWVTDGHIGKQGGGFMWDMEPEVVEAIVKENGSCRECTQDTEKRIRSEGGEVFTWDEFLANISPKDHWSFHIGKCFS